MPINNNATAIKTFIEKLKYRSSMKNFKNKYKDTGVDIKEGQKFIDDIKNLS